MLKGYIDMTQGSHEYYNFIATMYDDMYKDEYWQSVMTHIEAEILKCVQEMAGKSVLDLGAGTGQWSLWAANRGAHVVLVEPAKKMLEIAREKLANFQDACEFINCRAEKFTKKVQDKFDVIFILGDVLSYVNDTEKTLENVSKVAKSGAFLFGTVDNFNFYMKEAIVYGAKQEVKNLQKTGRLLIGSEYGAFMSRGISDEELIEFANRYSWKVVHITALGIFKSLHLNEKYGRYFTKEAEHLLYVWQKE